MSGRAGWGFVVLCAVVSSAACQPDDHRINVFNDTGEDIVITLVKHDSGTVDVEVPPDLIRLIILDGGVRAGSGGQDRGRAGARAVGP